MAFHELADDSNEISYFFKKKKLGNMSKMSSAAVVIGALRVNLYCNSACNIEQYRYSLTFRLL